MLISSFTPWTKLIVLSVIAILGNTYAIPLFFGVDFLLGSIAIMVILQRYGLGWGVLISFLASLYTYVLWGHPYAIVFLTCEAIWLGMAMKLMRGCNLVFYDVLYWLLLGIPLIILCFLLIMAMDIQTTWLVAAKWAINGIFNALCANLLLTYTFFGKKQSVGQQKFSFQQTIYNILTTFVLLVALGMMVFNAHLSMQQLEKNIIRHLYTSHMWAKQIILQSLRNHDMNHVHAPPSPELQTLRVLFSQYARELSLGIVLLDNQKQILLDTQQPQPHLVFQPFSRHLTGQIESVHPQIFLWTPEAFQHFPAISRWRNSFYVYHAPISPRSNWQLIIEQSIEPYQSDLYELHLQNLTMIFLIVVIGVWLSEKISHQIVVPLENLSAMISELSSGLTNAQYLKNFQATPWQESHVDEINVLMDSFKEITRKVIENNEQLALIQHEIALLSKQAKEHHIYVNAELTVAHHLQEMILPKEHELKDIKELSVASFMVFAENIGRNYYDILSGNGHVKIGIAEVTGRGLERSILMLMLQAAMQTLFASGISDPKTFVKILNQVIYKNIHRFNAGKDITLSLLDYHDNKLYLTGQHEETLLIRRNGHIEKIDTYKLGFVIGVKSNLDPFIEVTEVILHPGDGVVLYTNGLTEITHPLNGQYGIERLCKTIRNNWQKMVHEIRQAVIEDVQRYQGTLKLQSDITLLIIKKT